MARFDKNIDASAARPLSVRQLHDLLDQSACSSPARTDAVARFVVGGEGWEQAAQQLGGAFSDCEPTKSDAQSPGAGR